ncbi:MAG: hypothetical protein AMXMBFR56_29280 [Polyangiaceae bacterium]
MSFDLVPGDTRDREAPTRPASPPHRPPLEPGKTIEAELRRTDRELVRVSSRTYDGLELIELTVWRVRHDNGRWFRACVLHIAPGEAADVARALLEGARRAGG